MGSSEKASYIHLSKFHSSEAQPSLFPARSEKRQGLYHETAFLNEMTNSSYGIFDVSRWKIMVCKNPFVYVNLNVGLLDYVDLWKASKSADCAAITTNCFA